MPKPRNEENKFLPSRWAWKHGAFFYKVPPGLEHLWQHKQMYRLGATFQESVDEFERVTALLSPNDVIDPSTLVDAAAVRKAARPIADIAGVYFLLKNGEIVYVGRSDSITSRVSIHIQRGVILFDAIHTIPVEGVKQIRLEQLYIGRFRPKFNIYHAGQNSV